LAHCPIEAQAVGRPVANQRSAIRVARDRRKDQQARNERQFLVNLAGSITAKLCRAH
jgi:hypothetical protein